MKLDYYLFNPTGNVTAFVSLPVSSRLHGKAVNTILETEPSCEQVGFVSAFRDNNITIRMSGGEFCGNASITLGAYYCMEKRINEAEIAVNFEECEISCKVNIKKLPDNSFSGNVKMPKPLSILNRKYSLGGKTYTFPTVDYGNITHIICEGKPEKQTAETAVKKWCEENKFKALGIMFYNKENQSITPLVFVNESKTLFWESSCASGTAAVGEYLFSNEKECREYSFNEPKGKLKIKINENGELFLFGNVKFIGKKSINIKEAEL